MVFNTHTQEYDVPTIAERELAMGFPFNTTRSSQLSASKRLACLGQAMDISTIAWLFGLLYQVQSFPSYAETYQTLWPDKLTPAPRDRLTTPALRTPEEPAAASPSADDPGSPVSMED